MEPLAIHKLDAERDRAFLQTNPYDALWYHAFAAGDTLRVCARCRSRLLAEDWASGCPVCDSGEPLYFTRPNMLLATELVEGPGGVQIRRPLQAVEKTVSREVEIPVPDTIPLSYHVKRWLGENIKYWLWLPVTAAIVTLLVRFT